MNAPAVKSNIFEKLGKIILVGGGKMGEAIIAGLVQGALLDPKAIEIVEPSEQRRAFLTEEYGVVCVAESAAVTQGETLILAIKPQVFREVVEQLVAAKSLSPKRVISIAAGIRTEFIAQYFLDIPVVRVMPNTPLMVSAGMSVVAASEHTSFSEAELVVELFSLMGEAVLIEEKHINAATAISGSGPAYFTLFLEELAKAGEGIGLTKNQAEQMAVQTLVGTARQLQLTGESPEELRKAVTSPGGTTQAALESFAANDFGAIVDKAVKAALQRAEELS